MSILKPTGEEKVVFEGRIFEVVRQKMRAGKKIIEFETARRSPGVRLLIVNDNKLLLTREYRSEINGYDYRLPGGKVFDTLKKYRVALGKKQDLQRAALAAAKKECLEETGLFPTKINHFQTSHAGGTVVWDLFYFVVEKFDAGNKQSLEIGEIIKPIWFSFAQVKKMAIAGKIKEDRSVGILLRFLLN